MLTTSKQRFERIFSIAHLTLIAIKQLLQDVSKYGDSILVRNQELTAVDALRLPVGLEEDKRG